MPFEWVADHDPFPPKKKGGSSRRQTLRPTSGKNSATVKVPELASDEVPHPPYLKFLRMKGFLVVNNHVGSSEPNVGGLSHNNNEREKPVGGECIDKSADANVGDGNVNDGAAINDPQYKLFLENLRVDESGGFDVEAEPHSGLREPLRYEPERKTNPIKSQRRSEPSSERENDAVLEVQDLAYDGNGISENISRQRKRRENGNAKCMKNISGEGKRFMGCYTVTEGSSEEVEANAQTKLRRENVTYQRTKTRKNEKRVEPSLERENDGFIELLNMVDDGESKSDKISRRRKRRENNKKTFLKNNSRKRKRVMSSSKTTECSNGKDSRVVSWDDSYLAFMLCLRGDADLCIYTSPNGKQVKYPEEVVDAESSSSDVEILSAEDVSRFEKNMGFVITRTSYVAGVDVTPPILREKLIAELKRPYDATEYDNLLKEIKVRKQQAKCRQLRRSRDVDYETNVTCRSYLEMHPVLGRRMKLVDGNRPAVLNLLRGFFFYLKHAPYEMFQPWTDPECLSILPPTTADDAPPTVVSPLKESRKIKKC